MSNQHPNFVDTDRRSGVSPTALRLTERDQRILEHIHRCGGFLGFRHIHLLEFPASNGKACVERLRTLFQNGYLARTNTLGSAFCGETVYWLAEKGASLLGLEWHEIPHFPLWSQIKHDLAIVDILLCIQKACDTQPGFSFSEWIPERHLRANAVSTPYAKLNGTKATRKVIPDGFVRIIVAGEKDFDSRLILEVDLSTHSNPAFADEKVLPGIAWIRSEVYRRQFGAGQGRFLVITKSMKRLEYLKKTAENAAGKDALIWNFTTFDLLTEHTIFTEPIWYRADGSSEPRPLFRVV